MDKSEFLETYREELKRFSIVDDRIDAYTKELEEHLDSIGYWETQAVVEENVDDESTELQTQAMGFIPRRWTRPPRRFRCAACVAQWTIPAAAIIAYAAATGGIGVVALGNYVVSTYGVQSTVAHAIAAAVTGGGSVAAVARAACPECR